jgi:hypothetical protein
MLSKKIIWIGFGIILVFALLSNCSPTTGEVSPEPPSDRGCGDGICDDVEKKNPSLCPEDCPSPSSGGGVESITEEQEEEEPPKEDDPKTEKDKSKCEPRKWWFSFEGCGTIVGTEPNYNMCVEVEACITVDENCKIQGTGSGTHTTCEYTGKCTYEVQCSDFSMPISGEAEFFEVGTKWPSGQTVEQEGSYLLKLKVDSRGIYEDVVAHCPGASVDLKEPAALQTVFGSLARNNDGYFIFIEVSEPQDVEMGYSQSVRGEDALWPGLSYEFFTDLGPGNYCK